MIGLRRHAQPAAGAKPLVSRKIAYGRVRFALGLMRQARLHCDAEGLKLDAFVSTVGRCGCGDALASDRRYASTRERR